MTISSAELPYWQCLRYNIYSITKWSTHCYNFGTYPHPSSLRISISQFLKMSLNLFSINSICYPKIQMNKISLIWLTVISCSIFQSTGHLISFNIDLFPILFITTQGLWNVFVFLSPNFKEVFISLVFGFILNGFLILHKRWILDFWYDIIFPKHITLSFY